MPYGNQYDKAQEAEYRQVIAGALVDVATDVAADVNATADSKALAKKVLIDPDLWATRFALPCSVGGLGASPTDNAAKNAVLGVWDAFGDGAI